MTEQQAPAMAIEQLEHVVAELRQSLSVLGSEVVALRATCKMQEAQIAALREENVALKAENAKLREENGNLQARVAVLEEREGRNSKNSHKPSSSEAPWNRPKRSKKSGKTKKDMRKGSGKNRKLVPSAQVHETINHRPMCCEECGCLLLGEDPAPRRKQVVEPPEPRPIVTEHRAHSLECQHCGHVTKAPMPREALASSFGDRTHGWLSWLTGSGITTKRAAREVMEEFCGISMSLGTVTAIEGRMSRGAKPAYDEAVAAARASPVVGVDETPWIQGGELMWMWTMVAPAAKVTVFRIQSRRNTDAALALLGSDFAGTICTDRFGAYNIFAKRGLCWAHLMRNFTAMAQRPGGEWYGQRLRASALRIMHAWYDWRDGEKDETSMRSEIDKDRKRIAFVLRVAIQGAASERTRRQAAALQSQFEQLWTFLNTAGMEPTNNASERALRRGVLIRKRGDGTRGDDGSRYMERMLTIVETLRQQPERRTPDFLAELYAASVNQRPAPSLLPQTC
jgi:transposase/regulator of replication initiation timing